MGRNAKTLLFAVLAIFTTSFVALTVYDPRLVKFHVVDRFKDLTYSAPKPNHVDNTVVDAILHDTQIEPSGNDTVTPFSPHDERNFIMTEQQCEASFPGLYVEIERAVEDRRSRPITLDELESVTHSAFGYFRGIIYNQELYVIKMLDPNFSRGFATLMAMHRAIVTSPEPIPNIEFTLNTADYIDFEQSAATWTYARRSNETVNWLMPDFGYWSWPEPKVGSYNEVRLKARLADEAIPWEKKIPKIVWRGATLKLPVRLALLNQTKGAAWADVKALDWQSAESKEKNLLSMSDHCHYRFVAHTEGHSYSGRLKYLQQCRSVVVAHKLDWIQHYHSLLIPDGPNQNYVECKRDFSNLEAVMEELRWDEEKAKRIADNSVKTFRERYLTPAAEACYWRKFIKGWRSVSFEPKLLDEKGNLRGVPIESFILERRTEWDPY
ncbi:hypothetical protein TWF225_002866 [Orbilia oligospora]|uniref:Uncharacterized protein n=1 Tax=Orbilia oligospora TaxID=2813651 RepID=A0A7C8P020_ORBOL|nr:hypothetical protein TWF103_007231 [Orbilia oligospora]KAF3153957.1 hypothetical protein TWF751_004062 [Orbilia oligospora]KAF3189733.1 hypothetical protein TWF225_002866 [Orbilia oligospora]KAF3253327.1 hypothetical protein TWF128_006420 [Orbilia oligospora]KAF3263769.1 hypothetical protein TWF217_003476 [Orbilia oligospora]